MKAITTMRRRLLTRHRHQSLQQLLPPDHNTLEVRPTPKCGNTHVSFAYQPLSVSSSTSTSTAGSSSAAAASASAIATAAAAAVINTTKSAKPRSTESGREDGNEEDNDQTVRESVSLVDHDQKLGSSHHAHHKPLDFTPHTSADTGAGNSVKITHGIAQPVSVEDMTVVDESPSPSPTHSSPISVAVSSAQATNRSNITRSQRGSDSSTHISAPATPTSSLSSKSSTPDV